MWTSNFSRSISFSAFSIIHWRLSRRINKIRFYPVNRKLKLKYAFNWTVIYSSSLFLSLSQYNFIKQMKRCLVQGKMTLYHFDRKKTERILSSLQKPDDIHHHLFFLSLSLSLEANKQQSFWPNVQCPRQKNSSDPMNSRIWFCTDDKIAHDKL